MFRVLYYQIPQLCLEIEIEEESITRISFCEKPLNHQPPDAFERELIRQLDAWFQGEIQEFDLPFFATGSEFQLIVWEETMRIGYGSTISYGELAQRIGKPKAQRAVGAALKANPVPLLIPCHRVVGAGGKLTGYAGSERVKRFLLELERTHGAEA